MKKIVYNNCYGGFSLSTEAVLLGRKLSNNPKWGNCTLAGEAYPDGSINDFDNIFMKSSHYAEINRDDPILVQVAEQLGSEKASGRCAQLAITTVSGKWKIDEYDGLETVVQPEDIEWND